MAAGVVSVCVRGANSECEKEVGYGVRWGVCICVSTMYLSYTEYTLKYKTQQINCNEFSTSKRVSTNK